MKTHCMRVKLDGDGAHSAHFIDLWYDCFHDAPILVLPRQWAEAVVVDEAAHEDLCRTMSIRLLLCTCVVGSF